VVSGRQGRAVDLAWARGGPAGGAARRGAAPASPGSGMAPTVLSPSKTVTVGRAAEAMVAGGG
jgi:hypothetical protein